MMAENPQTPNILQTILQLPETSNKWSGGPYAPFKLVDLPATSAEYKHVEGRFNSTAYSYYATKIQRVENPYLLAQYLLKKQAMGVVQEKHYFHGTDVGNIDGICSDNFDWRVRGSTIQRRFGQGTSFARDAYYATHYSTTNTMIYAKVLVGKATRGGKSTVVPPEPCDTTRNADRTVTVKYEDNETYPEYVIHYEYSEDDEYSDEEDEDYDDYDYHDDYDEYYDYDEYDDDVGDYGYNDYY